MVCDLHASSCSLPITVSFVSSSYICISQGSVATPLRCGGIFDNQFTANFAQSLPVKEFFKCDEN